MPTIEQIRAARALLDWSQSDLADHAGLSQTGIARIENGTNKPNTQTVQKIEAAFDEADIEFLGLTGLRKRTGEIKILKGPDAMKNLLDDMYEVVSQEGTEEKPAELFMNNVQQRNWTNWMGPERWDKHRKRMKKIKDIIDCRTIVKEGDWYFPSSEWTHYKWFPEHIFNQKAFYSYSNRLAFLDFAKDDIHIMIVKNRDFAEGYRILFNIAWDSIAFEPPYDQKSKSTTGEMLL